jgi:glycine betaine/proline transport system ATP-binding protein
MEIIKVEHLTKIYGSDTNKALKLLNQGQDNNTIKKKTRQVVGVRDVSFHIEPGESFVIMGLSGSGKSTLLRCLNGLISATAGKIFIEGQELTGMPAHSLEKLRRQKMSMVFQRFALLPHRTVLGNVDYGLEIQGLARAERRQKSLQAIAMVGLKGWEDSYPAGLSGGMQQRVGIARALATDPDILLLDEPFSALDPLIRQEMQDELLDIQKRLQKTIVFITHDLDEALKIGDRIALMKDGAIVQMGQPEDILLSPATEYVARFVENVNYSKALTAASVMVRARNVVHPKDGPMTALHIMERFGMSSLFVTDRGGKLLGYVNADDASRIAGQGIRQLDTIIKKDGPAALPDTPLCELLEVLAHTKVPVAVVDEDDSLKGVLVRGSVIAGLAGERREISEQ